MIVYGNMYFNVHLAVKMGNSLAGGNTEKSMNSKQDLSLVVTIVKLGTYGPVD